MKVFKTKLEHIPAELNSIMKDSSGNILIKMHSDVVLETKDGLREIVKFFDMAPQSIGIVGPMQLLSKELVFSCGSWIIHPKGYHHIGYRMPRSSFTQPIECDVVSGAFLVFKREVFEELDGFDPELEGFDQTVDFVLRARMKGYRAMAIPQVEYTHWSTWEKRQHLSDLMEAPDGNRELFLKKWGFDYLHPDLPTVIDRYKGTELLWNMRWLQTLRYDKYEIAGAWHWDAYFNRASHREIGRVNFITSLVHRNEDLRILDLGCGDGLHSHFLAHHGHKVVGVDNSHEGIQWAIKKTAEHSYPVSPPSFQIASCYKLPFHDESFDCVFCLDLVEHLVNPIQMLREARRVLMQNGVLFLTTPRKVFHDIHERAYHVVEYEPYELESMVRYVFGNCQINLMGLIDFWGMALRT